jgi:predicted CXXCH cytochrome family protein
MHKEMVVLLSVLAALTVLLFVPSSQGTTVVGSRHDLSGGIDYNGNPEQVCIYCHTPHHASTDPKSVVPLWNRQLAPGPFSIYSSSTLDMTIEYDNNRPQGVSLACLSCHDGVNSGGNKHDLVVGPGGTIPDTTSNPNCERCHTNMYHGRPPKWLGTDLTNDHPISITYDTTKDPAFIPAVSGKVNGLPLYSNRVECPSCHAVHDPQYGNFLRAANTGSALCYKCHIK